MSPPVVRAERIEFEAFARMCDLHPDLLDRFVTLGLVETDIDDSGRRWLDRSQVAAVGRIRRLRSGLRLSYSAISVVAPLIDRIDELEDAVRLLEAERASARRRSAVPDPRSGR